MVIIVSIMPYSSSEIRPRRSISFAMDIAILYRKSCCFLCSSIGFHLLPSKSVAGPGAIFTIGVTVAFKNLTALPTHDPVVGFLVQLGVVLFPPGHAAAIRAVTLDLLVRGLDQRLTTMAAQAFVIRNSGRSNGVSATVGLYGILSDPSQL